MRHNEWEWQSLIAHHHDHHTIEDERNQKNVERISKLRADLENAHEVVGKALEWLVGFTETHEDDSAHELYLDLRKWYEGESAVQNSQKNTPI